MGRRTIIGPILVLSILVHSGCSSVRYWEDYRTGLSMVKAQMKGESGFLTQNALASVPSQPPMSVPMPVRRPDMVRVEDMPVWVPDLSQVAPMPNVWDKRKTPPLGEKPEAWNFRFRDGLRQMPPH